MAKKFTVATVFKGIDKITAPVTKMQNSVGKFSRVAVADFNRVNRSVTKLNRGLKRGAVGTGAVLAASATAARRLYEPGLNFEQALIDAAVRFPGEIRKGTVAFDELSAAAKEVGLTTRFTAVQGANALNFMALAGMDARQSVAALPGVVNLAIASGQDLATATDIATDSIGAFGLATKDAGQMSANLARINDVLALTSIRTNTTIAQMFEGIKEGAAMATGAGASVETFSTLLGAMANAGIKGSQAGTTLKNVFLRLSAPIGEGAAVLQRLGVVTRDSEGDLRDTIDVFNDLGKALDGLGTGQRTEILNAVFGRIPIAGVNVLLQTGTENLRALREELEGAAGTSGELARVMQSSTKGSLLSLKSAIEAVSVQIFTMNQGPLKGAIDGATAWVRANQDLIATNVAGYLAKIITHLDDVARMAPVVAKLSVAYIALSAVFKTTMLAAGAFNVVMNANPIGLAITAVGGLIFALSLLERKFKIITRAFTRFRDGARRVGGWFGVGTTPEERQAQIQAAREGAGVVSPQERVARSIEESIQTQRSEVTIRDNTGLAEVTQGMLGPGLSLVQSGAF